MRQTLLPYGHQSIEEHDIDAVVSVLRSDMITGGPKIAEFEEALADRVGAADVVAFSSGTAALHGASFAAGIEAGDEAIVPTMTFCATANCIVYQGGKPIFVDVDPTSLTIDPGRVAACATKQTRAILPVDFAGNPAPLDEIVSLAEHHGWTVIEDACHALGATYKGKPVGSVSTMSVFSFHPVKHITTGEGGAVATNDPALAQRLRTFRNHGIDRDARARADAGTWFYEMTELGFNYRITDIACALGLSQMNRLDQNLRARREIAARYSTELGDLEALELPVERVGCESAWHLYAIRIRPGALRTTRDQLFAALRAENIGVNVHYIPVHLHPYYRERFGTKTGEHPVAEDAFERIISIPMFHGMTKADQDDVIEAVRRCLEFFAA